jgi:import inner membrane translocase subunit TIM23
MSVRAAKSVGRLNSITPSLIGALRPIQQTPRTASQITRLSSTTARPLSYVTLNSDSRPQAKSVSLSTTGLRSKSTAAPANAEVKLDWDSFFKLRASRRRYSLASSVATSIASTTAGVQVLSGQDLESLGGAVMGLDPFVVLGLATAACGAAGWLVGPIVGNGVWGLVYRKFKPSVNTVSICNPRVELLVATYATYLASHTLYLGD